MPFVLLILFLAYPLLEIALLIRVGGAIGLWPTLLLVIGTAAFGMYTLRHQGLRVMRRAAESVREGRPPVEPVLEGAIAGLGGGLLIVPGILSDLLGAAFLVPPIRRLIARAISRSLVTTATVDVDIRSSRVSPGKRPEDDPRPPPGPKSASATDPVIIEGEFTRIDETPVDKDTKRHGT